MAKIAFVTDSTAYLLDDFVAKHKIKVVPMNLHWDGEDFKDNVNITPKEFYTRLEQAENLPTTSQPSAGEFLEAYKSVSKGVDAIIVPLVSSGISGTVASALLAAKEFDKVPVHVVDSKVTSAGLALLVQALVRKAESGASVKDILAIADKIIKDMGLYFLVDTLKYLHKGGRIGGASALLGSAINLKPILYLNEAGEIDTHDKVRTKKKAVQRLIDLVVEKAGKKDAHVGLIHAEAEEDANKILADIKDRVNCVETGIYIISPVIGTHTGPGALGVAVHTIDC
jgi:DegV family protein with EDD domain